MSDGTPPRAGSGADLAARMDRIEKVQESQGGEIGRLSNSLVRIETLIAAADRVADSRWSEVKVSIEKVDLRVGGLSTRVDTFMADPEASGIGKERAEADRKWRMEVDHDRRDFLLFITSARTLTRVALLIAGSSWVATAIAIYAFIQSAGGPK
jgi:hypothetical protein